MNHEPSTSIDPHTHEKQAEVAPPERSQTAGAGGAGGWVTRLIILGAIAGVGVAFAGRIRTALEQQKQTESARGEAAKVAQAKASAPPSVGVVQPIEATWLPSIGVEGTLMPAREADLAFKVPGQLARLDVKAGDWVEAGATLGALDVSEAAAQLRAAEAQVRVARAQVFLAEDDAKRMETLAGSGAATTVMAGDAKGRAEISAGQLDAAQAQLVLSQTNVRNHSLTAPFAGFVTKAPTAAGGIVGPSAPLFHLQDVATLRLVGTVSEQDIGLIKPGATLTFAVPEGDGKSKTIEAKVTTVLPSVDPQTRRVPFEAEVKNEIIGAGKSTKTVSLRGGTFVRGKLAGDAPITVLRLPATVIRPGSQDEVLVVDQGKVHARRISFATAADGAVLVRSGLAKNETVMLTPVAESKEGDVVTPITTPDEGARNLSAGSKGK